MHTVTINDLKKVIALSDLPDEHLQWLLDHSTYYEFEDGTQLIKKGDPADVMWIMLEGKVSYYLDVNGKQVYYYNFENDHVTGGIGGLIPYSRMKSSPGYAYAVGPVRRLELHRKHFTELERLNPDFIHRLIGYMTERARYFATVQLQHEKVSALGKLAAGIAHELNNPASAIDRMSSELKKRLARNYLFTEKLLHHQISSEHIQSIRSMVETKEKESPVKVKLTPLQRMEKEDEITDWFEQNGLLGNHLAGETFAEAGFTGEDIAGIRRNVGKEAFIQVLHWLENLLSSQRIMKDLEDASTRISKLVGAIKSHVHMDRTHELQPTDIHRDLDNTVTLLGYKLRDKNISVKKNYCTGLPEVQAYVGELNQVWTNLIDNAIFAMEKGGILTLETVCDSKSVTVKVIDNGSGIPPDIISRIFDPFFTTKKVGQGTGIGLDLVNRIAKRHNGEVKVFSVPGKTEFDVCLPFSENKKTNE
jgi:signal transduction histidine kinase